TLAAVAGALRVLALWSTNYGGSFALHRRPGWENVVGFFGQQVPTLVGGAPRQLLDYNVISAPTVGHVVNYVVIGAWLLVVMIVFARRLPARATLNGMSTYLVLVGVGQVAAYLLLSPYPTDKMAVRYVLLALLALSGFAAFAWRYPQLRAVT